MSEQADEVLAGRGSIGPAGSDRAAADRRLRESEAQFRTLAEALPGLLFVTSPDGRNSYVNETFRSYTGLAGDALLGDGWMHAVHPDDLGQALRAFAGAVQAGTPFVTEYRVRRHDGEYRCHAVRALRIPDGVEEAWVGTCVDVHDTRLAGRQVREAEARYRAVFEQAGVGVARVSPDGAFLEINDRYCQILRRSRGEILGGGWKEITHPEDVAADTAGFEALLRGEVDTYSMEKRYLAPDGDDIWVNLTVAAERDENGRVLFLIPVVEDIGERITARQALRQSEAQYRALFESMEQGFCVVEVLFDGEQAVDHRFLEINPAFTKQSGLPAEVVGKSLREAVPGLEDSWYSRYGKIAATGVSERFIDRAEALGRWFEVYAFRIGEPERRQVAILFTDVTDRVKREQELRQRLNAIPQMVWSTLPDGYHDFYNPRWYEFTGTPPGSTDGEGWNDMFHPDDQERAWERWQASLASGEPYEIEYRLRHHSGEYRWVLGRALPVRNAEGEIVRWMGTCTDIHDAVEARTALMASEARLRAVIEAAPVGLLFADASGQVTGVNANVEAIIGKPVVWSEDVSSYAADYVAFHEDGRPVESGEYPLAQVLAGASERAQLTCRVRRVDGELSWVRYVAAPVKSAGGAITGGVVASIDVDREKRLAESLEREVEKVIGEREAAQDALRQSQKLDAMGQLTGGVAHDFNNLLTPIIGSLDLLHRKELGDGRTRRLIDGALQSAERAKTLVQRLLAFARRQPLQPAAVDVARVVSEMADLIGSTSGPRIRVEVAAEPDLPPAHADGNQLEMALLNLSVNARDAMPDGGTLKIGVRLAQTTPPEMKELCGHAEHIVLTVADTGGGMDERTLARCIEPFFSTKGVGKGTGLGLSMVHGLAAQLGGALTISSRKGQGTAIELWLPVSDDRLAEDRQRFAQTRRDDQGLVLLVDDEELVRESTASMLGELGYLVVEADSAEEALRLVGEGLRPDLLVSDHLMPGLSGTDLAVRLRQGRPGLPVLIVSGYADVDSLSPAFPRLAKPFRQSDLATSLAELRGTASVSFPAARE